MWIVDEIINKFEENWKDWSKSPQGGRCLLLRGEGTQKSKSAKEESHFREENLSEVRQLFALGLITMNRNPEKGDWVEYDYYPHQVHYRLEDMGRFYELAGVKPKWERIAEQAAEISAVAEQVRSPWISQWLSDEKTKTERGLKSALLEEEDLLGRRKLYRCLKGLDELEQLAQENADHSPMFHRAFSKRYLGNSKTFEKELEKAVLSIARKYHPEVPEDKEAMDDVDVLEQLHLEIYSQELTLKGSLRFRLTCQDGTEKLLDTADYPYGLVLNQQTLSHLTICEEQEIHRVRMIENKANFMAEPYEAGKLVIFTHGYITPLERKFLIRLREVLEQQRKRQEDPASTMLYEHCGDLDYGGICIYRYLREKVFPQLVPYRMDMDTYEVCLAAGMAEPISEEMAGKLQKLSDDPQLGELAYRLAKDRLVVEQEAYL